MWNRTRTRYEHTNFVGTRVAGSVTSWPYERWVFARYERDIALKTGYESISDDWHRGTDRTSVRNVLHIKRHVSGFQNIEYFGSYGSYSESQSVPWYFSSSDDLVDASYQAPVSIDASDLGERVLESISNDHPQRAAFAALPFIGELKATIEGIRNPFGFLSDLELIRKRRFGRLGKRQRQMSLKEMLALLGFGPSSQAWLSFQYGWKPLMSDLTSFGLAALSFSDDYDRYLNIQRGVAPVLRKSVSTTGHGSKDPGTFTGFGKHVETMQTAGCNLWYRFKPTPETLSSAEFLRSKMGLTARDIIPAAWELVPYSFIVDWVLPVGDRLSKVTRTPIDIDVVKTQYTNTVKSAATVIHRRPTAGWSDPVGMPNLKTHAKAYDYEERIYERHPYPFVGGSDPNSSWITKNRAISALSLIAQQLLCPIRK